MRRTVLIGTSIETSVLGFGCAILGNRLSTSHKQRLLDAALDAGITHFDVARLYGFGDAETQVGKFLRRHTSTVTVTTKIGLNPPTGGSVLAHARSLLRPLLRFSPGARSLAARMSSATMSGPRFAVTDARQSLEMSLRKLKRDGVDLLLLHECRVEDITDGLLGFLDDCLQRGLALAVGTATDPVTTSALLTERWPFPWVAQIPKTALDNQETWANTATIIHSVLSRDLPRLIDYFADSPTRVARWSAELDIDCGAETELARFLLADACGRNPRGITLFSSRQPAHIGFSAAAADQSVTLKQREAFDALDSEIRQLAATP